MNLVSIKSKTHKRIGRGLSAGQGKTAGRGTKGQKSRSGHNIPRRFEGGQTPISMRLPKLPGFKSGHEKAVVITLDKISRNYKAGEEVSLKTLIEKGLAKKGQRAKVLNTGKLTVAVSASDDIKISEGAASMFAKTDKPATKASAKKDEVKSAEPAEEKPAEK